MYAQTITYTCYLLTLLFFLCSWGESAGAWSVALHMVANGGNTEGLFHGAFMESGSPLPVGDITHGQKYYDALVSQTGCSGSQDSLECLRQAPYDELKAAMDASPSIFSLQVCYTRLSIIRRSSLWISRSTWLGCRV